MVTPGENGRSEYIFIGIVNIGHRETQITGIGWKTGIIKKQHAMQVISDTDISSPLPIRLKDGETAKYFIPLIDDKRWLKKFATDMMSSSCPDISSYFLKLQIFTSIGKTFETRLEKGLRKMLVEIAKNKKKL